MFPDPFIEAARLIRFPTAWDRIWHDYDLMTIAGIPDDEAYSIAMQTERDRQSIAPQQALTRAA